MREAEYTTFTLPVVRTMNQPNLPYSWYHENMSEKLEWLSIALVRNSLGKAEFFISDQYSYNHRVLVVLIFNKFMITPSL